MKMIDLSICVENGLPSDPASMIPRINYLKHDDTVEMMMQFFPGISKSDLPGGKG